MALSTLATLQHPLTLLSRIAPRTSSKKEKKMNKLANSNPKGTSFKNKYRLMEEVGRGGFSVVKYGLFKLYSYMFQHPDWFLVWGMICGPSCVKRPHVFHRFGTALKDEKPVAIKCLNLDSPKEEEVLPYFLLSCPEYA